MIWPTLLGWQATKNNPVDVISAALKREREEAGMGAINWFLFSKDNTAKAKREIAQKYCTRKHVERAHGKAKK